MSKAYHSEIIAPSFIPDMPQQKFRDIDTRIADKTEPHARRKSSVLKLFLVKGALKKSSWLKNFRRREEKKPLAYMEFSKPQPLGRCFPVGFKAIGKVQLRLSQYMGKNNESGKHMYAVSL